MAIDLVTVRKQLTGLKRIGAKMTDWQSFRIVEEMKEFASFTPAEQRYIRRSLDVADDPIEASERWSRNHFETKRVDAQAGIYKTLIKIARAAIPEDSAYDSSTDLMGPLITLTAFDLGEGKLLSFRSYRFLYERLLGASARPWLPSAFVAAAALPYLHPQQRKSLLGSLTESDAAAVGWSSRPPLFSPEWVDKVPVTVV